VVTTLNVDDGNIESFVVEAPTTKDVGSPWQRMGVARVGPKSREVTITFKRRHERQPTCCQQRRRCARVAIGDPRNRHG
jgi:hypothetical protein